MSALISVETALSILAQHGCRAEEETVPLSQALGRRLAQPVIARLTLPPSDVSAMDGYAVRVADVREAGAELKLIGETPAGNVPTRSLGPGETMRIFTGAPLPEGADHILVQEEAERDGEIVRVTAAQGDAQFVRRAGIDFHTGDALVVAGTRLGPAELAIAAAGNHASLAVERRPKVAIIAGGNELRPPGSDLKPGQIVDSISTALGALVRCWGGEPVTTGIARDSVASIREQIDAASDADIIVPVGGASVGDHDHTKAAFAEAGAEIVFSKIAVKPGKPTWFARRGEQRVLGLPGNPASAYVCAHLFLRQLLPSAPNQDIFPASLLAPLAANGSRETYLRGRAIAGPAGMRVEALPNQDSSLLRPFLTANCLIRRPAGTSAAAEGDTVDCLPLTAAPETSSF